MRGRSAETKVAVFLNRTFTKGVRKAFVMIRFEFLKCFGLKTKECMDLDQNVGAARSRAFFILSDRSVPYFLSLVTTLVGNQWSNGLGHFIPAFKSKIPVHTATY